MCVSRHTQVSGYCEEDEQERKGEDVCQEACNILTLGDRRKERIMASVRGKSVQIG